MNIRINPIFIDRLSTLKSDVPSKPIPQWVLDGMKKLAKESDVEVKFFRQKYGKLMTDKEYKEANEC